MPAWGGTAARFQVVTGTDYLLIDVAIIRDF